MMRIDLMNAFGGSAPPTKLSILMTALPPAMSCSCCASSFGSSDSDAISSCVNRVVSEPPLGSAAEDRASRATVTVCSTLLSSSLTTCLLSPARSLTSFSSPDAKPRNTALMAYRPGASAAIVATPCADAVAVATASYFEPSSAVMVTTAPGKTEPVASTTVTSARDSRGCAAAGSAAINNANAQGSRQGETQQDAASTQLYFAAAFLFTGPCFAAQFSHD